MGYKSIMVCLDSSKHTAKRLEFALQLALKWGAHVTGLHLSQYFVPYVSYDGAAMFIAEIEEHAKEARDQVKRYFYEKMEKSGVTFDWLTFDSREVESAILHARTSDLLIAGQRDIDDDETFIIEGFPETFLLRVGRPMLFVPHKENVSPVFDNVLVAWNGSRESTRALTDALPLLRRAQKTYVLTVEQHHGHSTDNELKGIDIGIYLSRHGVSAEMIQCQTEAGRSGVGHVLLTEAERLSVGLVVAGAYGHSRLTELILGGVTKIVLKDMNIPVLMSH